MNFRIQFTEKDFAHGTHREFSLLRPDLQLEKKEGEFSAKTRKEKDETTSIAVEIIYESLCNKKYFK